MNVGAVIGTDGLLVIDTRADRAEGGELRDDLRVLDPRPPRWVVNTHAHFDHVGGNPCFVPAEFYGPAEDRTAIHLGDRRVILRHLGPGHTGADVVVAVPDADAVFAGDLVEESAPPAYGDDSFPMDWPLTNARLLGLLGPGTAVVPGHGAAVDRGFCARQQQDLVALARTIRHLWVGEVPADAALAAGTGRWPWPADVLADAVARGYEQLRTDAS
ncbi:MAG: MBL fold metallo-hydrolase [Acidimicrobiales bacterium]